MHMCLYNSLQATANVYLLLRCFFGGTNVGQSVITVECLQTFDVVLSLLRVIRSDPTVTAMQTCAKIFVAVQGKHDLIRQLGSVWAMSDLVRYMYHIWPQNHTIRYLRYSQYSVMYPIGVALELMCILPAIDNDYLKCGLIFAYLAIFPHMYNHTSKMETKQKIIETLQRHQLPNDAPIGSDAAGTVTAGTVTAGTATGLTTEEEDVLVVHEKGTPYRFSNSGFKTVRSLLSGPRYSWKPTNDLRTFVLKDHGIQVRWRMVYVVEYTGALLLFPLVSGSVSGVDPLGLFVQQSMRPDRLMWTLHYAKRIYESLFVHSFSSQTMPFQNLFKNCAYYWGAAVLLGYCSRDSLFESTPHNCFVILLWALCQLGNGFCHSYLAGLRPPTNAHLETNNLVKKADKAEHVLPDNVLFQIVTCPNYTYEILGWALFACLGTAESNGGIDWYFWGRVLFCSIGAAQMYQWACGKRRRYKILFGDKYKVKGVLLPGI